MERTLVEGNSRGAVKTSNMMASDNLICIVDDDDADRSQIEQSLSEFGYSTNAFSSGTELLGKLESLKPSCIILDVRMPRVNGIELLEILTLRHPSIPVIMVSGKADIGDAVSAIKNGAIDFIRKPADPDELNNTIASTLSDDMRPAKKEKTMTSREEILSKISPRELEVLKLLLAGESNKEIAFKLGISTRTVEVHRANLMQRLEVKSFAELIRLAVRADIDPD